MKKIIATIILIFIELQVYSQQVFTLDSCLSKAVENFPKKNITDFDSEISTLKMSNIKSAYYPKINLEAEATYQSDVFRIELDMPDIPGFNLEFPEPPLDRYNIYLSVNQVLYDGGLVKSLSELEEQKLKIEFVKSEQQITEFKQKIEEIYFSVLVLRKSKEKLNEVLQTLNVQKKNVESAVKNDVTTPDNVYLLEIEIVKLQQKNTEIEKTLNALYEILEFYCEEKSLNQNEFKTPFVDADSYSDSINFENRAEIKLIEAKKDILSASKNTETAKRMPKLYAFANAGYGNPGLTMINDEWNPYFIVGAKLSWNIWDYNNSKKSKKITDIEIEKSESDKKMFEQKLNTETTRQHAEIEQYKEIVEKDNEIIELHKKVSKLYENKLRNGIITTPEYLKVFNSETAASLSKEINTIKLAQAKRKYQYILGNLK